jgi:hypothetical protein
VVALMLVAHGYLLKPQHDDFPRLIWSHYGGTRSGTPSL